MKQFTKLTLDYFRLLPKANKKLYILIVTQHYQIFYCKSDREGGREHYCQIYSGGRNVRRDTDRQRHTFCSWYTKTVIEGFEYSAKNFDII